MKSRVYKHGTVWMVRFGSGRQHILGTHSWDHAMNIATAIGRVI